MLLINAFKKRSLWLAFVAATLLGACGNPKTGSRSNADSADDESSEDSSATSLVCGESSYDNSQEIIRLKGKDLLVRSIAATLGPNKDRDPNNPAVSMFERNGDQFGSKEGLTFGKIYADEKDETRKAVSYFLSLNIIADGAAKNCSVSSDVLCKCDTPTDAAAMLQRAIPYRGFCADDKEFTLKFADLCKKDSIKAITALVSSVAFALRN